MSAKAVAVLVILLCAAGGALALANGGGDPKPAAATATPAVVREPMEIALRPAHHSGVSGTARLVPGGKDDMTVTLTLDKHSKARLPAHIHTGPCSKEPTAANPRIWANLEEVRAGRSKTYENIVTLGELRAEGASINVHDPEHGLRAMVCGDIPRG
jgi:cytochrome c556